MNDFSTTAATAGAQETEKIRAILECNAGKAMPAFARLLAFETSVDVSDATKILNAVANGIASSRSDLCGGLGISEAAIDAGWARAVADTNRRIENFDPAAGSPHGTPAADDGWGAAAAAANRAIGAI